CPLRMPNTAAAPPHAPITHPERRMLSTRFFPVGNTLHSSETPFSTSHFRSCAYHAAKASYSESHAVRRVTGDAGARPGTVSATATTRASRRTNNTGYLALQGRTPARRRGRIG